MKVRDDAPEAESRDLGSPAHDVLCQSNFSFNTIEDCDAIHRPDAQVIRLCGEDLMGKSPLSGMVSMKIADDLAVLTGTDERTAIGDLLRSFGLWASILPASERNHHCGPFGLLQHSIKVAWRFLAYLLFDPRNRKRVAQLGDGERRCWLLSGTAAALLHDCGKLFDMEVKSLTADKVWDPLRESVTDFICRHQEPETVSVQVRFRPGRGLKSHEAKGRALLPAIVPSIFNEELIEKTRVVYDACGLHHELENPAAQWPASWLAAVILTADREDSATDLKRQQERLPIFPPQAKGR